METVDRRRHEKIRSMNDSAASYRCIKLDVADGVAWITFNLPRFGNALDLAGVEEAVDALAQAEVRDEVGAVVLTGAGKQFCSGFNLREVPSPDDVRAVVHHFRVVAWWWHRLLEGLIRLPKPVLAAVNGAAAGSGLGMVLCSDLAVAKESARFMCAWHAIGLANDATTSYSLSKIVGFRRAMELMLTNRTLSSAEALEWGLVNRVFPDGEFDGQVKRIARELAEAPTHLQAFAKESFHRGWRMAVEETTAMEIRNVLSSLEDPAFADRLRAFLRHETKNDRPIVDLS
jgi:enoyl-CoA hydratase/carnithine racemase